MSNGADSDKKMDHPAGLQRVGVGVPATMERLGDSYRRASRAEKIQLT